MSLLGGAFAAVTGGARGLGAGITRRLAAEGARGAVLDLPSVLAEVPAGWEGVAIDVRDEESVQQAFANIDRLDVLVAAAGIVPGWAGVAEQRRVRRADRIAQLLAR